ncbi:DNA cytosine methyltransferase [Actinomadura keratinilytica]
MSTADRLTSIEICAGAGGQAVGLHGANFRHLALVEIDPHAAATLARNVRKHPQWAWEREHCLIINEDVNDFKPLERVPNPVKAPEKAGSHKQAEFLKPGDLDLLAGGVPCPPFSAAGKQLGRDDERDLFPKMLDLVDQLLPRAVMIENVRGLVEPEPKFRYYRNHIKNRLRKSGYVICGWNVLHAQDYGVPQLRPRAILVAIRKDQYRGFDWPAPRKKLKTVAEALEESMARRLGGKDSPLFKQWWDQAKLGTVAPTLVGGSKKHGGADLGPSRAKKAWKALGVNGMGVANDEDKVIDRDRDLGNLTQKRGPMLTVEQAALIQGFPTYWEFEGKKTAQYRQVGNAFPPPVAEAVGRAIAEALQRTGELHPDPAPEFEPEEDPALTAVQESFTEGWPQPVSDQSTVPSQV